jgi:hypothetical protein
MTAWHSESALLICSFEYTADTAPVPATVAEHIDAALGISTAAPRALLGNIDVAWRDESRLHSIELRTGRGQWQPASLRTPTDSLEASSMTFGLDYDINGVASVDLEFAVLWDATRSRLALRFDTADPAKVRWVAIADTVFACVDSEQSLIEIQFDSVAIVAADPLN